MVAGFSKGQYFRDFGGDPLVVKVESDHFASAEFGWTAPDPGVARTGYGAVTPRRVHGVNIVDGVTRRASVVVADITADAWQEGTGTFHDKDQDGTLVEYEVTSRTGEVRRYGM